MGRFCRADETRNHFAVPGKAKCYTGSHATVERTMTDRVLNIYWDDVRKKPIRSKGSAEHFWHFMLGYFLPLMRFLLQQQSADPAALRLYDCGPLMNRIVVEGLSHLRLRPEFDKSLSVENDLQDCLQRLDARGEGGQARRISTNGSEPTSRSGQPFDGHLAHHASPVAEAIIPADM